MKQLISLILGGGAGTRLFPLTKDRAKPAVPLAGKYRLIDIPISNCINSGINRIFVLTQFNSASLNRHISRAYRFDRFGSGFVSLLAAEQTPASSEWFQGTADAVRRSLPHIRGYPHQYVLILSGDQLYSMDYRKMLAHHREHEADVTVLADIAVGPANADLGAVDQSGQRPRILEIAFDDFMIGQRGIDGTRRRVADEELQLRIRQRGRHEADGTASDEAGRAGQGNDRHGLSRPGSAPAYAVCGSPVRAAGPRNPRDRCA